MLNLIETSPSVQHVMPFMIKHIEENYNSVVYNGALKKNLYVMVLDALFNNELINLDFHVRDSKQETHHHQDLGELHNF